MFATSILNVRDKLKLLSFFKEKMQLFSTELMKISVFATVHKNFYNKPNSLGKKKLNFNKNKS